MNLDLFKPKIITKKSIEILNSQKLNDKSFAYGCLVALGKRSCNIHDGNKPSNKSGLFIMDMRSGRDIIGYIISNIEADPRVIPSSEPQSTISLQDKESQNDFNLNNFQEKKIKMMRRFPSLLSLWDEYPSSRCVKNNTIIMKPAPDYDSFQSDPLSPSSIPKFSFNQETSGKIRDPNFRFLGCRKSGRLMVYAGIVHKTSRGDAQVKYHKNTFQVYDENGNADLLFKELVLLWHKSRQEWVQISVYGNLWSIPDVQLNIATRKLGHDNVLEDGSLLYSQGTTFLFRKPRQNEVDFEKDLSFYFSTLICPVTLEKIPFSKLFLAIEGCTCSNSIWKLGSTKSASSFLGRLIRKIGRYHILERFKSRPWFFSECGHIYSYHEQFKGYGLCPTCRSEGFYRPLSCLPVPELLTSTPDTVLVPCGHVIGAEEAFLWKQLIAVPFEDLRGGGGCGVYWRFACPFCSSRIDYSQTLYPA